MRTRSSSSIAFSFASLRDIPWCTRNISPICQPTVNTGFNALSASWKIIAIEAPRSLRRSSSGSAKDVLAAEAHLALGDVAGRGVEDAHDRLGGDALAGPGLPEHGQRLARLDAVAHPVDGAGDALAGAELDVQVVDLEQRFAGPDVQIERRDRLGIGVGH